MRILYVNVWHCALPYICDIIEYAAIIEYAEGSERIEIKSTSVKTRNSHFILRFANASHIGASMYGIADNVIAYRLLLSQKYYWKHKLYSIVRGFWDETESISRCRNHYL